MRQLLCRNVSKILLASSLIIFICGCTCSIQSKEKTPLLIYQNDFDEDLSDWMISNFMIYVRPFVLYLLRTVYPQLLHRNC
jgi:hypothetical protein